MHSTKADAPAFSAQLYAVACFLAALGAAQFLDRLTNTLLMLSTFLLVVICRFACRYMQGDPGRTRFLFWLCFTATCVFVLVLAQNLLLFALAWCSISLGLHQLLQFYRHRPGARLAARKKFLISRLGDMCMLAALALTYRAFGTWNFPEMFAAAAKSDSPERTWIALFLTSAALLKSAQFPFHSWLPDTMETPTPVSALMHAGIINGGGILVIRLMPLVSLSPAAMWTLCAVGSFTALFASIIMLTQASVKRRLAFSTIAQMGFMLLECGLGAVHLALLHIVAHSLYKAHAFLASGGAVAQEPRRDAKSFPPWRYAGGLAASVAILYFTAFMTGTSLQAQPALTVVLFVALAELAWSSRYGWVAGLLLSAVYFQLEHAAVWIATPLHRETAWLAPPLLLVFLALAIAQANQHTWSQTEFARGLYVHARNGFYLNTLANRFTMAMWPLQSQKEQS